MFYVKMLAAKVMLTTAEKPAGIWAWASAVPELFATEKGVME